MFRMYKAGAVLSSLMKVYTIPCHDRGYINVMLVLQSCTNSLTVLPGSSSNTFQTSSDGTCDVFNVKIEEDIDAIVKIFIAVKKEVDIGIKQEENPDDITSDIKSEPDEVSCVCLSVTRHILLVPRNVFFFYVCISGQLKRLYFWE